MRSKRGRPKEKDYDLQQKTIYLRKEIIDAVKELARSNQISESAVMRVIISKGIESVRRW